MALCDGREVGKYTIFKVGWQARDQGRLDAAAPGRRQTVQSLPLILRSRGRALFLVLA